MLLAPTKRKCFDLSVDITSSLCDNEATSTATSGAMGYIYIRYTLEAPDSDITIL